MIEYLYVPVENNRVRLCPVVQGQNVVFHARHGIPSVEPNFSQVPVTGPELLELLLHDIHVLFLRQAWPRINGCIHLKGLYSSVVDVEVRVRIDAVVNTKSYPEWAATLDELTDHIDICAVVELKTARTCARRPERKATQMFCDNCGVLPPERRNCTAPLIRGKFGRKAIIEHGGAWRGYIPRTSLRACRCRKIVRDQSTHFHVLIYELIRRRSQQVRDGRRKDGQENELVHCSSHDLVLDFRYTPIPNDRHLPRHTPVHVCLTHIHQLYTRTEYISYRLREEVSFERKKKQDALIMSSSPKSVKTEAELHSNANRLTKTTIHHVRDPERYVKLKKKEEEKLAPFEGPEVCFNFVHESRCSLRILTHRFRCFRSRASRQIVVHKCDTSEQNKLGQNGEKKHRGCSRNALGGFFSS